MMPETGGSLLVWESMKYSADRMLKIFGQGAGLTREEAEELAFKEKEIAERGTVSAIRARPRSSATPSRATAGAIAAAVSCRRRGATIACWAS